jgi:hypothetical protein
MNLRAVLLLCCVSRANTATTTATTNSTSGTVTCTADKNNGFAKKECGAKGDPGHTCCHATRQVCVSGKAKLAKKTSYACSKNRALYGLKLVKVVFIPAFSLGVCVFMLLFMLKGLKAMGRKPPALYVLCVLQVVFAAIVCCSSMWKFALYSAFLAFATFHFMREFANKWVVMTFIALQFFNVVAMNGAVDKANGIFLPLGFLAADNVASWEKGILADKLETGAGCTKAFDNYFTLEGVEIAHEGRDPDEKYFGFCTDAFLGTVGVFLGAKMMTQFIMIALSFGLLIPKLNGSVGQASDEQKLVHASEEKQSA